MLGCSVDNKKWTVLFFVMVHSSLGYSAAHEEADPHLVPIIDELLRTSQYNEMCVMHSKLQQLAEEKFNHQDEAALEQIRATQQYIENKMKAAGQGSRCEYLPSDTSVTKGASFSTPPSITVDEEEENYIDAEAAMGEALDVGEELCANCSMDYDEQLTQEFSAGFDQEGARDATNAAKGQLISFFLLCIVGIILVVATIATIIYFAVWSCLKKLKRNRSDDVNLANQKSNFVPV